MKRSTRIGRLEVQTIPHEGGHQVALLDVQGFYAGTPDAVRSVKVFGADTQINGLHDIIVAAAQAGTDAIPREV